ncbi:hypothetical protein PIB30_022988 [Stylosanthes scabra]|uniref:Uncharacterized protein n=1 Tax=Stylosanthes scabra TaxID=79078 RepID=A0ABU6U8A2_9FABA|nr:hypothetical protein [Stylosanthes scabra]
MPSTGNKVPSSPFSAFGRSILAIRRGLVKKVEANHESGFQDSELESFQKHVTDRFRDLSVVSDDDFLSIAWMHKLLDAFIFCHEEFRAILLKNKDQVSKSPLDQSLSEFLERSVKALDICNASRDGIEKIHTWLKHVEIISCALGSNQRAFNEGQFRRARKALMDLALAMLDEKESGSAFSRRNRSFGRNSTSKDHHCQLKGHSRSHSWSVSPSWSAAKQLQSIASNLVPPRANEIIATRGLAVTIYTMNSVLLFVLLALVAAIPCQDRGLNIQFSVPRQFPWSSSVTSLYERIMEESRKRKNSNGLLKEINQVERFTRHMTDLVDSVHFPLTGDQKVEVEVNLKELTLVCEALIDGLDPLEGQVKEAFRKIMTCRIEMLDLLGT